MTAKEELVNLIKTQDPDFYQYLQTRTLPDGWHPTAEGYADFLTGLDQNDTCRTCAIKGASHQCSVCKVARYCGVECQRLDWTEHKKYCAFERLTKAAFEEGLCDGHL